MILAVIVIAAIWAVLGFIGLLVCMGAARLTHIREEYSAMYDDEAEINEPTTEVFSNRFREFM